MQQQYRAEQRKATTGLIAHCSGAVFAIEPSTHNAGAHNMQRAVKVSVLGHGQDLAMSIIHQTAQEQQTGTPAAAIYRSSLQVELLSPWIDIFCIWLALRVE
jgi:hypothetical protein